MNIEKRKFAKKAKKLEVAAFEGDIEQVKVMLASGMPVNIKTWEDADRVGVPYNTPLSAAVIGGHADLIDFLLDAGAPVNEINCKSTTPFIEGVIKGNFEILKKLVAAGADIHQAGEKGNAIFHLFKKNDDAYGESCDKDILKYLLDSGVDPNGIQSAFNDLPYDIKHNSDIPIDKSYLDMLELLQIVADNWKKGRSKINAYAPCNYKKELKAISQPLLVVAGTADEAFIADEFESEISKYTTAQVELLPDISHMGIVVKPDIQPLIKKWLEGLRKC